MAGTSSSLVVKISADINDFLSSLDKMTKGVDKAAERVAALGEKLTIGLTVPLAAAAVAMAKFAADSEDTSARFERVFGSASDSVKRSLESISKVVPETVDELEKLAVKTDAMLRGMEIAPQSAAQMSGAIVKLAGDLAAFNHVPVGDALQALEQGLAGRTRSLLEMGVAISKTDITQEAYREGILHTGNTLTEAGTAQAAFNLIMQKTSGLQGEATRTAGEQSKSWEFLLRDVKELGTSLGQVLVPPLVSLVNTARDVVNWINNLSDRTKTVIIWFAATAAIIGPLLIAVSKLAQAWVALRAAFTILSTGSSIAGFFAAIANPVGLVIAGIVLLTGALVGLYAIWQKFHGKPDDSALNNDPQLAAFVAGAGGVNGKLPPIKGGPTEQSTKSPFQLLESNAGLAETAFSRAADYGTSVYPVLQKINQYHAEALTFIKGGAEAFSEESVKAQALADKLQLIRDAIALNNATPGASLGVLKGIAQRPYDAGLLGSLSAAQTYTDYYKGLRTRQGASQYGTPFEVADEAKLKSGALAGVDLGGTHIAGSVENDLALRQAMLGLPDGFNAAKLASVQYAEAQRQAQEDTALAFETIKIKLGPLGGALDGFSQGMQNLVVSVYNAAEQIGQAILSRIGGSGKNASTGRGIGGLVGGIAGSFFGPVGTSVGTFLGSAIGGQIGSTFDHNTTAVNANTLAVNQLTESITNVPQFFKIGYYDFIASPPKPGAPLGPVNPPPSTIPFRGNPAIGGSHPDLAPSGGIQVHGDVHVYGVQDVKSLYEQLKQAALRDRATGSTSALAFSRA